jgi:GT2 family glycosyltransferase
MKLSIVVPVLNQHELAKVALEETLRNLDLSIPTEVVIIDNGSDELFQFNYFVGITRMHNDGNLSIRVVRNEKSIGVYPTFKQGMAETTGDIVAFFHSDVVVWEKGWNARLLQPFESSPNLGLVGFIGSNEIDSNGGRGGGTTSNFQGKTLSGAMSETGIQNHWIGSPAEAHGKRSHGFSQAAVVDGCVMVLNRQAWERIGSRDNFPPHHFYDRLISTQMLEAGFMVGVLGIAFDHISGQTVNREREYQVMAHKWLSGCHGPFYGLPFVEGFNYDLPMYATAERMWLEEYRGKGLVPTRV